MSKFKFYVGGRLCKVQKNFAWSPGTYSLRRQYICKLNEQEKDGSIITYWFNQHSKDGEWTCTRAVHPGKGKAAVKITPMRVGHFEVEEETVRKRA